MREWFYLNDEKWKRPLAYVYRVNGSVVGCILVNDIRDLNFDGELSIAEGAMGLSTNLRATQLSYIIREIGYNRHINDPVFAQLGQEIGLNAAAGLVIEALDAVRLGKLPQKLTGRAMIGANARNLQTIVRKGMSEVFRIALREVAMSR